MKQRKFLATCARGAESFLATELETLGCDDIETVSGGVIFFGDIDDGMKVCLHSFRATRVLLQIATRSVRNETDIYALGRDAFNPEFMRPTHSIAFRSHLNDENFTNSNFLSLKVKDGLVDKMRESCGERCSIDLKRPDVPLFLMVSRGIARVFLELQGAPLNERGYRRLFGEAPIRETLAASVIAFSEWNADRDFLDPMCGSGTFVIEAALKALNAAPGIQRHFAVENWPNFPDYARQWSDLRENAKAARKKNIGNIVIEGSDVDPKMVAFAQRNASTEGVENVVRFKVADIRERQALSDNACVIVNPPYGERLNDVALTELYYEIGRHLRNWNGNTMTMISLGALMKKHLHMKPSKRLKIKNGALDCEVANYELGGRNDKK